MIITDLMLYSCHQGYFALIFQHKEKLKKQVGEGWASDHKPLYPSQIEAFSPCYMHTGHNLKWTVLATESREHSRCAKVLQLDV